MTRISFSIRFSIWMVIISIYIWRVTKVFCDHSTCWPMRITNVSGFTIIFVWSIIYYYSFSTPFYSSCATVMTGTKVWNNAGCFFLFYLRTWSCRPKNTPNLFAFCPYFWCADKWWTKTTVLFLTKIYSKQLYNVLRTDPYNALYY